MKIIPNIAWDSMLATVAGLQMRIKELERQNLALLDRLLIEKGHLPIDVGLQMQVNEAVKEQEDLITHLTEEEVGEYPPDVEEPPDAQAT